MKFLILLLIIIVVLLSASGFVLSAIMRILGLGKKGTNSSSHRKAGDVRLHQTQQKKEKIFDHSEGEYVDFEEVEE